VRRPHRRFAALACVCTLFALPAVAHAETTKERIDATRSEIDAAAQRWFDAQRTASEINDRILTLEQKIVDARARVEQARSVARGRALLMYENSPVAFTSVIGTDALDFGRRTALMERANEQNNAAIETLTNALSDMREQHDRLLDEQARQRTVLQSVAEQRNALDAQLDVLRARAAKEDVAKRLKTKRVRVQRASLTAAPTRPVQNGSSIVSSPAPAPAPPPAGAGGGGVNPHHSDAFLACTRGRESGGNYGAVSPGGTYYGAYQFLPSTWDSTAVHAGRQDLVGVLPTHASQYDQDEMAWTLYQWQGKAPWGGRC
jgi:septal ring factor EnvC (AmiA/AmiB activator)